MCFYHLKGNCKQNPCQYEHIQVERDICIFNLQGKCTYGQNCRQKHVIPQSIQEMYKEYQQKQLQKPSEQEILQKIQEYKNKIGKKFVYREEECKELGFNILQNNFDINSLQGCNLILIRHAISRYNYIAGVFTKTTGISYKEPEALHYQIDGSLIDSELHEYGEIQAQNQQKIINKIQFHTVFVSPLKRALQTCYFMFKNHPEKQNIKFIVLPLITEIFSKVQDIASQIDTEIISYFQSLEDTIQFDFSLILNQKNPHLWQIENLIQEDLKKDIYHTLNKGKQSLKDVLLDKISSRFPDPPEDFQSVQERSLMAKDHILGYIQQNKLNFNQNNYKIAILSHNNFFRNFTASGQIGEYIQKGKSMENCELLPYTLK